MRKIQKTQNGTVLLDGIEFNQFPAPFTLIKAMERKWALRLRDKGCIRLRSVQYYQKLESSELGDRNEGQGMFKLHGDPIEMDSLNKVFIWCSSYSDTDPDVLKNLDPSYDTIIHMQNVKGFVDRIVSTARSKGYTLQPHIGAISYNRGDEVSKVVLDNQKWHYNIFQKDKSYAHQKEYRLSFTNCPRLSSTKVAFDKNDICCDYLDLELGDCRNIIDVEI